jgi:hypothetical protein
MRSSGHDRCRRWIVRVQLPIRPRGCRCRLDRRRPDDYIHGTSNARETTPSDDTATLNVCLGHSRPLQFTDLAGKRLELLREVVPGLRGLAIMANVGAPGAVLEMREAQAAASRLGLDITTLDIRRAE